MLERKEIGHTLAGWFVVVGRSVDQGMLRGPSDTALNGSFGALDREDRLGSLARAPGLDEPSLDRPKRSELSADSDDVGSTFHTSHSCRFGLGYPMNVMLPGL